MNLIPRFYQTLLRHPIARWFVIGGTLVYLLSPIDISPDGVPFIGWIDDGVLATLLVTGLVELLMERRQALRQKREAAKQGQSTTETSSHE